MANKDTTYPAGWTSNLAHSASPNRISHIFPKPSVPERSLETSIPKDPSILAPRDSAEPSYYDIPMLKAPLWKWEIASYFFLGGLSAGAYLIARVADRFGDKRYSDISRAGAYLSLLTLLPCPPLLIHDLGDPKRFHHMLRVWKPQTPMNLGTWALVAYGGMVTYEVVRRYLCDHDAELKPDQRSKLLKLMNNGTLLVLHDTAGIPFAIVVASYTGVLLSCTANPLWSQNPWLAPLFAAGAISTGAEAINLTIDLTHSGSAETPAQMALRRIDTAAHIAEGVTMNGFMRHAGERAGALRQGKQAKVRKFAAAGMLAAEVLKILPVGDRLRKPTRMLASALGLASGFALRWAMVYGAQDAANDPRTSRLVSKASSSKPVARTTLETPQTPAVQRLPGLTTDQIVALPAP
jgi:formate-dependent nitrite reductase membrane component NrfD